MTPADPTPASHHGPSRGRIATIVAVVAVFAALVVLVLRSGRHTSGSGSAQSPVPTPTSSVPPPASTTPGSASPAPTVTSTAAGVPLIDQGYVPLYPFRTLADAQAWQQDAEGHQPWHLDAGRTALSFTQGYLGFAELDVVAGVRTDSSGAHVDVGYRAPDGHTSVAATLHLMRFGTDDGAPWEVVGSDDTTFTLDLPPYASTVVSPLRAGGYITGVDESIVVSLRQLGRPSVLATAPAVPAGGEHAAWRVTVAYSGARSGPMTVVASTGGHVQRVERFAVTGVLVR